jgi:hypothetical protein
MADRAIELLFRWIKQHLRIRRFLGNNDNEDDRLTGRGCGADD